MHRSFVNVLVRISKEMHHKIQQLHLSKEMIIMYKQVSTSALMTEGLITRMVFTSGSHNHIMHKTAAGKMFLQSFRSPKGHLPFFRTTSSDSGLRVTETTFMSRRLPPCLIRETTCLWPTFTTLTPFTCRGGRGAESQDWSGLVCILGA